ncbi:MAG: 6-hydroxymethylpterin diphosphokinase MptE-like protein [Promethearchaeota archaeon]
MCNKKASLKAQIDFYETFKEQYFKIIDDLHFDYKKDCKARDILSSILKSKHEKREYDLNLILKSFKINIHSKKNIFIYGCGPSLVPTVNYLIDNLGLDIFKNVINIAADGASIFLGKKKIPIQAIFTDLDGITKKEFNNVDYMIIHGHGDNIDRLEYFKQEIIEFCNIIGTTQVEPSENLINPGGFTDGDRILYFLQSLLSLNNKLFLIGMDFNNVVGRYSKLYFEKNQEGTPMKKRKLRIAVQLIEQILPKIQNDIFFVNTNNISNEFKYLSLEEFIHKI